MTEVDVPITVFYKEDLNRDFPLYVRQAAYANVANPSLDMCQGADLTGATFSCEATFDSQTMEITVTLNGSTLNLFAAAATVGPFRNRSGRYDLMMVQNGVTKRLWSGPVEVTS